MSTEIRFYTVHSLKCTSSVRIAILLWNGIQSIPSYSFNQFMEQWQAIEDSIKRNVCFLHLPKLLEGELKCFVKPIGFQILKWLFYHKDIVLVSIMFINKFYWTDRGTIDRKKTAEWLVANQDIQVANRYKLACIYCLENEIPVLWSKISINERRRFITSFACADKLTAFWTYKEEGKMEALNLMIRTEMGHNSRSVNHALLLMVARSGNVVASEYFLNKLTTEERKSSMVNIAAYLASKRYYEPGVADVEKSHYTDVLCFLLSRMRVEEQAAVFAIDPIAVFYSLTDWPFQDVLLQVMMLADAENFLRNRDIRYKGHGIYKILESVAEKESPDSENYIHNRLFTDIWQCMPAEVKEYLVTHTEGAGLLSKLFSRKDRKNIKLILGKASQEVKSIVLLPICRRLVDDDDLDLLGLFIKECAPDEKDVMELKEKILLRNSSDEATSILQKINTVVDLIKQGQM